VCYGTLIHDVLHSFDEIRVKRRDRINGGSCSITLTEPRVTPELNFFGSTHVIQDRLCRVDPTVLNPTGVKIPYGGIP
jgi:hypothetical protein